MTSEEHDPGVDPELSSEPDSEPAADPDDGDSDDYVWRDWTREDVKRSAIAGVAAYLASYALLYLWFLTDGRMSGEFTDWRWVGWILYRGQFVPLDASPGGTSPAAASIVESQLGALENVVPALLLAVAAVGIAGFLLARARTATEPEAAAKSGASLVVGHLPLAVLGVAVFGGTLPNGIHVRPSPIWAPLVAGVAFPGVVGALGGMAYFLRERRANEDAEQPAEDEAPEPEAPEARP